jgi:hypothetical protein
MVSAGNLIPIVVIVLGASIAIVAIVVNGISSIIRTRAIEASRREIAAYVAEGTIKPEDAAKLLSATPPKERSC